MSHDCTVNGVVNSNSGRAVGVVVLNWNKREDLLLCLEAVRRQSLVPVRVLVVDNASTDNSVEAVRVYYPEVDLLVHEKNLGGSAGFNSGIRRLLQESSLEYIQLLDNDASPEHDALEQLLRPMVEEEGIAVTGSKLLVAGSASRLQELGANIDWQRFHIAPIGQGQIDGPEFESDQDVDYVPACSALLRVSALREVGLMDEGNFLYWDDIEWGWRFNARGWKVKAIAASRAWHKMGVAERPNPAATYYFWRNRLNFFINHTPWRNWSNFVLRFSADLHDARFGCWVNGKKSVSLALRDALVHGLTGQRGRCKRSAWPESEPKDTLLRRDMAGASRLVLYPHADIGMMADLIERLRRSFKGVPLLLLENSDCAADGLTRPDEVNEDDWVILPCHHVLRFSAVSYGAIKGKLVWADRHNNLLPVARAGRLRWGYLASKIILLPLLALFVGIFSLPMRFFPRFFVRDGRTLPIA